MAPKGSDWYEEAKLRAEEKKTHVSFPQLKYPSLRDNYRDSAEWLEGKALDDGAEGIWRVHDKLYDLTDFIKSHPGGEEWLELTKGTDITEAFECHHLTALAPTLLEKFYVRPAKTPRNSPFTFHEDGFYKTLKAKVVEEMKKIPKEKSRQADMITDGMLVSMLIFSSIAIWFKGTWTGAASILLAGLSVAWLAVCSHNYIHRRTNWRMYLFNFTLRTYRDFRVAHALSHHLYPNTLMDLEISMFEPLFPWLPKKKGLYAKLAIFVEMVMFPLIFFLGFVKSFYYIVVRPGYFQKRVKWNDYIGLSLPIFMWVVAPKTVEFSDVLWVWIPINLTASFVFHLIGLNAAHHHPDIFHDGDQSKSVTPDWGMHELEAVMDRTDITGSLFRVMTFFGDHALHHLFPTLDHAMLCHLYPVFLEHCDKFKANFRMTSSLDLFLGQIKQLVRADPKPVQN